MLWRISKLECLHTLWVVLNHIIARSCRLPAIGRGLKVESSGADLEAECGQPIVTRKLAEPGGYRLVKLRDARRSSSDLDRLLKAAKESSEALAVGFAALADKIIDANEAPQVIAELDDAIVAFLEAREGLAAMIGGIDTSSVLAPI